METKPDSAKAALSAAFPLTVPVLFGYLFLGIAFGVLLSTHGLGPGWSLLMGIIMYAGASQFLLVELLAMPFAPLKVFILILMVNARHLFYGLSLLDRFRNRGKFKPYLIFALTDETYAVQVSAKPPDGISHKWFDFWIALLNHLYWIAGSLIGSLVGTLIPFSSEGIDFAMTALFLVIFVEQWEAQRNHRPAVIGLAVALASLVLFGAEHFIIVSMVGIALCLILLRRQLAPVPGPVEEPS